MPRQARRNIAFDKAAIASLGESKSDAEIVFELAKRLGFRDLFWNGDIDAGLNAIIAPLNMTLADLCARPNGISISGETEYFRYKRDGFKTPTGKIELFSEAFRDAGENPLPRFVEPAISPFTIGDTEYPLVLTSAKAVHYCHGQHRDAFGS